MLCTPNQMRWTEHVACTGDKIGAYRVFVGKHERKRPIERPRRRWEESVKMDLQ